MASSEHFTELLKTFCNHWINDSQCDVVLFGSDGTLNAHRIILSATSDVFRQALAGNSSAGITHISLPDIDIETMQIAVSFMYIGVLVLPTSHQTSSKLSMLLHLLHEIGLDRERLMNSNAIFISDYAEGGWQRLIKQHLVDTSKDLSFVQFRELYSSVLGEEVDVSNVAGLIKKEEEAGTETEMIQYSPQNLKDVGSAASRKILVTFQCQSCGLRFHDRSQYKEHREEHARKLQEMPKSGSVKPESKVDSGQSSADTSEGLGEGEPSSVADNFKVFSKDVEVEAADLHSDAQVHTYSFSKDKMGDGHEQDNGAVATKSTKKAGLERKRCVEEEGEVEGKESFKFEIYPWKKFNYEKPDKIHFGTKEIEDSLDPSGAVTSHHESLDPSPAVTSHHDSLDPSAAVTSHHESLEPSAAVTSHHESLEPSAAVTSHHESLEPLAAVSSHQESLEPSAAAADKLSSTSNEREQAGPSNRVQNKTSDDLDSVDSLGNSPMVILVGANLMNESNQCQKCFQYFLNKQFLAAHDIDVHGVKYSCEVCAYRTGNKKLWIIHNEKEHKFSKKYFCSLCEFSSFMRGGVPAHMIKVHKDLYDCPVCKLSFSEIGARDDHVRNMHADYKPYSCTRCASKFKTNSRLEKHHQVVHMGVKEFNCEKCPRKFADKGHLGKHYETCHGSKSSFKCSHCLEVYGNRAGLTKHLKTCQSKD